MLLLSQLSGSCLVSLYFTAYWPQFKGTPRHREPCASPHQPILQGQTWADYGEHLGGPKHWSKLHPLLPDGVPIEKLKQQHWNYWQICHGWLRFNELTGELQVSKGDAQPGGLGVQLWGRGDHIWEYVFLKKDFWTVAWDSRAGFRFRLVVRFNRKQRNEQNDQLVFILISKRSWTPEVFSGYNIISLISPSKWSKSKAKSSNLPFK